MPCFSSLDWSSNSPRYSLDFGSNGWIGNQVVEYLKSQNINYIKGNERVDASTVENYLNIDGQQQKNMKLPVPTKSYATTFIVLGIIAIGVIAYYKKNKAWKALKIRK